MKIIMNVTRFGMRLIRRIARPKYQVQVRLPTERHGSNYGGWYICPIGITPDSVIYSFGVGEDISFDLSMIARFGVTVYAFDPTPKSIRWVNSQKLPENFKFFEYGIADYDGAAQFNPPENLDHVSYTLLDRPQTSTRAVTAPVYRLKTIMEQLQHQKIDLLKMDVEGAEYSVIDDLTRTDVEIGQLLVEFHSRFERVGWAKTKEAVASLNRMGFRLFCVSASGDEFSFSKMAVGGAG